MSETDITDLIGLKGRKVLITGGAGHIARAMTKGFVQVGANVLLVDRYGDALRDAQTIAPDQISILQIDLEDMGDAVRAIMGKVSQQGSLNILINNAAFVGTSELQGWATDFSNQDIGTWRRALEINLTAPFALCQALAPLLRESGHGSIINIGSIYGVVAPDPALYEGTDMGNPAAYGASKSGLFQLTRYLATTLAPDIRVNMISPGGIFRDQPSAFVERYEKRTPLGRMGREDDIRGATLFLAGAMSSYITGQNILVDGGWTVI